MTDAKRRLLDRPLGRGGIFLLIGLPLILVVVIGSFVASAERAAEEQKFIDESGTHAVTLSGEMLLEGRWQLSGVAVLDTNAEWTTTTLHISMTKLDNAVDSSTSVRVVLDNLICETQRDFAVTKDGGGKIRQGEIGEQELRCSHFVPLAQLQNLTAGTVG
jgi:hypothetical protein